MTANVLQPYVSAGLIAQTLIRRTMDNLNNKLSNEAQNQPSCLGAVSGSFLFDKALLEKAIIKQPEYVMGVDTYDKDALAYCFGRKVDGVFEIMLDEISLSVRRYSNSPAIVFYSIDIDYGKLLFYAYSYKRREGIKDRSVFINKMCEYSLKLSNFWKILNECLIRLNSNGDFTFTDDDSSLDDSSFLGEKMRIVVAYKK